MGNTNTFQKARLAVIRLSLWQALLTAALALIAAFTVGSAFALSVIAGGAIGVLAGSYQAQRMLSIDAASHPGSFMQGLWTSELMKIVITVVMFLVAIRVFKAEMVPTIVGYGGTYLVYWIALGTRYPWFDTEVTNNARDKNWPDI